MRRRTVVAALLMTAACSGKVELELQRQFDVDLPIKSIPQIEVTVDLTQSAPDLWKRRNMIKSFDVHSADLAITTKTGNAATKITGATMKVRLDCTGDQVLFASIPASAFQTGTKITLDPTSEGIKVMNDALHGTGKFCWSLEGGVDKAPVKFTGVGSIRFGFEYAMK